MKIGITFFRSKLDLLCISKVLTIFCVFSKIRRKRKHSRGHVAYSPSARGSPGDAFACEQHPGGIPARHTWRIRVHPGFSWMRSRDTRRTRVISRGNSRREGPRDTWLARRAPGCGLRFRHSGTGGELGRHPEGFSRLGYSGHVSLSEASGGSITRRTRGALGSFREGPMYGYSGHVSLSEAKSERGGSKGGFEGWLPGWLSGHLACSEGLR